VAEVEGELVNLRAACRAVEWSGVEGTNEDAAFTALVRTDSRHCRRDFAPAALGKGLNGAVDLIGQETERPTRAAERNQRVRREDQNIAFSKHRKILLRVRNPDCVERPSALQETGPCDNAATRVPCSDPLRVTGTCEAKSLYFWIFFADFDAAGKVFCSVPLHADVQMLRER